MSAWLENFQREQQDVFLARGLPTRREERWKYTDVSYLKNNSLTVSSTVPENVDLSRACQFSEAIKLVFVNGHYAAPLSSVHSLTKEVILLPLRTAIHEHEALIKPYLLHEFDTAIHPFASLNNARMQDGLFLYVPSGVVISVPIHCLFINTHEQDFMVSPRHVIIAEANSEVTILEEHCAEGSENYFTNSMAAIYANQNAHVTYHKIQQDSLAATHIAHMLVEQKKDSVVKMHTLAVGSRLARDDIFVNLRDQGASCSINGFYAVHKDGQHIDNHIQIDHLAPHGTSEMVYKGTIDKKSRAVFNGKVFVHTDAQKTQSQLANHNLLLSADAEIDTKPEFEIYADDVKCTHGDTVGQLDEESLFYLQSRGIAKKEALTLLSHAFSADVINGVAHPDIRRHMNKLVMGVS